MILQEYFEAVTDKRQEGKVKHNLLEIIVMTICAVIAGCEVWEDICDYCRVKEAWLRSSLGMKLEHGIPSHDTMQRVWSMIDPSEFEICFCAWVEAVCGKKDGEVVSVDGKTLRRSGGGDQRPIHMVSAWANEQQLVLGELAVEEKSNEITAVPQLLDMLDVAGCVVTADAMSCQKEITKKIIEKDAEYVLSLKENQPMLCHEVQEYFSEAMKKVDAYPEIEQHKTLDCGHGRIEKRTYYLSTEVGWYQDLAQWTGIRGFGMVRSEVERNGQRCQDTRYFITSLSDLSKFANAVRKHWGIENSLHWCLDMTFHEDYSRIRKDHSAENMAVVRHIALNILKSYPENISLARKRRRCSYDDDFLATLLRSVHA